jgi:hypothetical protein
VDAAETPSIGAKYRVDDDDAHYRCALTYMTIMSYKKCQNLVRETLAGRTEWPTELIAGIMGITRMAHCWALDDTGMLRRNGLISDDDVAKLRGWVWRIESVVEQLLANRDPLETYPELREIVG